MKNIIDRVESNKIDKIRKLLLFCGIGILILSAIKFSRASDQQINGIGWWIDNSIILIGGIVSIIYYRSLSNRSGQFIEWQDEIITYKLKGNKIPVTIQKATIKKILINMNLIEILNINGTIDNLDIQDFSDYNVICKIKENFEKQRTEPNIGL